MSLSEHETTKIVDDWATATLFNHGCRELIGKQMRDPRKGVCRFQALLGAARLPNVRRQTFRPQLQGYGCPGRLGEKSDEDFSEVNAVWTQCSLDSHAHVLNHDGTALRRAAANSGAGLVPQESGDDLPSSAAIQLGGQQSSDH